MIHTEDMRAVITRIQKLKTDPDVVSPNYVAEIAHNMKRDLTIGQIVYISDNFTPKTTTKW